MSRTGAFEAGTGLPKLSPSFGARVSAFFRAAQRSRMKSVLRQFDDKTLKDIGISRAEINAYVDQSFED